MPKYDAANFDPPAPVAYVTLRNRATGASISEVPMLIDTGADVTLVPGQYLAQLEIETESGKVYEIQGFDGEVKLVSMIEVELSFLGKRFSGQFLVIDQAMGILGRNILNEVSILFDGPRKKWDEQKR